MTKKLFPALAALALAFPGAGRAQVKIGFINSITGPEAPIGENLTNGVEMAIQDLAKKGIHVNVLKQDSTGKPQVAMSGMEQLATGDNVAMVVGPYTSANSNAVSKLAEQYKVPEIIPVAAKEDITKHGYKYVFRLNGPAHQYAQSLIDAAFTFGHPKSIAFIHESTDFGSSVSDAGVAYAKQKGLKILADESYQKGAADYRSTLSKIKAEKPDLVFMVSYVADAILLMRQSREIGLTPQAFLGGGAGFDTAQFQSEHDISNDVFSVTQWTPESSKASEEFAKRYEQKYGSRPSYHAALAYEAMMIAGEVATKAGGDREKIRHALDTGEWHGLVGDVKFEDYDGFTNQNKLIMPVIQYQHGKSVTVYPPKSAQAKAVYPFPGWK